MKRALPIFLAGLSCLLYTSCSQKQNDTASPNTITFWNFWSEPSQQAALQKLVSTFEQQHPGVKVELTGLSWNDGKAKLLAAFNSGTAPDVLELGSDWVAQFSSSNVLLDITPQFIADTSRYVSFSLAPAFWGGKMYCLPWVVDTRVLFYNKALMKRAGLDTASPPATWDELNTDCEKISSLGDDMFGFGANAADAHRLYKKVLPFFWANGGDVVSPDGKTCTINSPQNIEALDEYLRLTRCGMMETQKQLDAQFAQGKIGFWISGGWLRDKIKNENPSLDYGIELMPAPAAHKDARTSFAGGEYLAIAASSHNKDAAGAFIKFLSDGANTIEFCKQVTEAGYPADKKYFDDPFLTSDPQRKIFTQQLLSSRLTPVNPKWLDIEKIIEDEIVEAMYGDKTSADALNEAQQNIQALLSSTN
ncbi:MAG TPA: extracellular solute-binding protein [Candidatus Kapabacteria bacterium]|nr:extracellular solute-binding protein [Candidatus Kapabacteria bacterium]